MWAVRLLSRTAQAWHNSASPTRHPHLLYDIYSLKNIQKSWFLLGFYNVFAFRHFYTRRFKCVQKWSPKTTKVEPKQSKIETKTRPLCDAKKDVFWEVKSAPYIERSWFLRFWDIHKNCGKCANIRDEKKIRGKTGDTEDEEEEDDEEYEDEGEDDGDEEEEDEKD